MRTSVITFAVQTSPEGGYEAHTPDHGIFTQAESIDELRQMVRDAVRCHFEDDESPREIRLHFVRADGIELETASIGKSIKVHGLLSGRQDLVIDGCIEGSIDIPGQTVTIGVNGRIHASINALDVIIYGAVEGNIHAEHRVELHKTASLCGNISSSRISIHDGAYFRGSVDIHQPEHHQRFGTLHETIDEVISA